ncbi:universal stress protein PHOS34 [Exaiptasia diaphana]|uniref:UspA domain-containing protein n=1 Tax=Exaiptasia diaphana TaxID=2652724 RepID=A0A913Y3Z8_EXADI|nr:universal stress protein PHOS34 [Exaiptasia diaphana]
MAEDKQCDSRRKVVIACDGSEHSERALDVYLDNMVKPDDHVILYHAFECPSLPVAPYPYGFSYYEDWSEFTKQAEKEATEILQMAGSKCTHKLKEMFPKEDEAKPELQLIRENGKAGEVICGFCQDVKPAMLIMGSRGQGTLRRTLLGSVSDYCIHHTNIPVLVVPPPHSENSTCQEKQD